MIDRGGPVALSFHERFAGPAALGPLTPLLGAARGRRLGSRLVARLEVGVDDLAACLDAPGHPARLDGAVSLDGLLAGAAVRDGTARFFVADAEVGMKRIEYRGEVTGNDGVRYRFEATSFIRPRRARRRERATAYARLVTADAAATVVAAGTLRRGGALRRLWSARARGLSPLAAWWRWHGLARRELAAPVVCPS